MNAPALNMLGVAGDIFLSPKDQEECAAVNGTIEPYYTWVNGTWETKQLPNTTFLWIRRQWNALNITLRNSFDSELLMSTLTQARAQFIAQIRQTYQYCR